MTRHDATGISQSDGNVYKSSQACEEVMSLSQGSHGLVSDVVRRLATSPLHCGQVHDKPGKKSTTSFVVSLMWTRLQL